MKKTKYFEPLAMDKIETGFISPAGEFILSRTLDHENKAYELCQKMGVDPYDDPYTFCDGATDVIVYKMGWIVIHGIYRVEIEISDKFPVTQAQKIALGNWLIRNRSYYKMFSSETEKILLDYAE